MVEGSKQSLDNDTLIEVREVVEEEFVQLEEEDAEEI